jgi:hypothetical protein
VAGGQLRKCGFVGWKAVDREIGVPGEGKTSKSSGMANCSITSIVEFPEFLGVFLFLERRGGVFWEVMGFFEGVFCRWGLGAREGSGFRD